MRCVPLRTAVEITGLHPHTLRKYGDAGQIPCKRTPYGQRLFDVDSWIGARAATVCYARVSSHKQRDDLHRQVDWLKQRCPDAEIVTDIGSGLNFKRKGLRSILERSLSGEQLTVMVAHSDRLARFGVELIRWILERNGGQIMVLGKSATGSPAAELTQDLLAIFTVFAARNAGLRKYKDKIAKDQDLSDTGTGCEVPVVDGCEQVVLQPDN